ncbi:MAG: hypothetical protein AAAB13_20685 [Pseudomonas sp.]
MIDTKQFMQGLASGIDEILNGNVNPKKNGFVVLVFPFDQVEGSRTNYVSNCERRDIIAALKEVAARFEGQPYQTGRA